MMNTFNMRELINWEIEPNSYLVGSRRAQIGRNVNVRVRDVK